MRDEFQRAQFESGMSDSVILCPYCRNEYQPEAEDYSETAREDECSKCGKKYWIYQSFTVDHHFKPDCELNGEPHKWDGVHGHPGWESCDVCDKWRRAPVPLPDSAGEKP